MPILNDYTMDYYLILRSDLGMVDFSKMIYEHRRTFFGYKMTNGCSLHTIYELIRCGYFLYLPPSVDVICSTFNVHNWELIPFISRQKFVLDNKVYYLIGNKFYIPEQYVNVLTIEQAYSEITNVWINLDPRIDPSHESIEEFRKVLLNSIKYFLSSDRIMMTGFQVMHEIVSEIYASKILLIELNYTQDKFILSITCTHPGKVIGKGGARVEVLKQLLQYHVKKYYPKHEVEIDLTEFNPLGLNPNLPLIRF